MVRQNLISFGENVYLKWPLLLLCHSCRHLHSTSLSIYSSSLAIPPQLLVSGVYSQVKQPAAGGGGGREIHWFRWRNIGGQVAMMGVEVGGRVETGDVISMHI